jgi:hypothetical protein
MAWRQMILEDVKLGTLVRDTRLMNDGGYCMGTIVSLSVEGPIWKHFKIARPYAYAHKEFSTNQPLLGAEVYPIGLNSMGGIEVFEGRDGNREMTT